MRIGPVILGRPMANQSASRTVLWAKYLDWCSAQVADRFLALSPEEIYALAHEGSGGGAGVGAVDEEFMAVLAFMGAGPIAVRAGADEQSDAPSDPASGSTLHPLLEGPAGARGESFRALVGRVAEVLAARLELPSFDEWSEAYRQAPERYEAELAGLWREWTGKTPDAR